MPQKREILQLLTRDELAGIVDRFELSATDRRSKDALVDAVASSNLTGAKPTESSPPAKKNGANGSPAKAMEQVDLSLGDKLTVDRLEGYLWSAADILRGSIDSSDYKNFIFGILFLKRLSDRFEEECEILVKEGDDPEEKDNHQFFVPKRARWSEIQKVATDLGGTLKLLTGEVRVKPTRGLRESGVRLRRAHLAPVRPHRHVVLVAS